MSKTAKRFAIGTLLAAITGYLAGILTAPQSGRETRKDIKDTAERGIAEAEKQLKKLHTELDSLLGQAKEKADTAKGTAKKEIDQAMDAAKLVKEKARVVLSAIHEGDADDKDLKKAINDANKAVDHLKTYLKKQ